MVVVAGMCSKAAAIFPEKPDELSGDLTVEDSDLHEIIGVIGSDFPIFFQKPIRKPAISNFSVVPRAAAHNALETNVLAQLHEMSQIS